MCSALPTPSELGTWRIVTIDTTIPGHDDGQVDAEAFGTRLDALDSLDRRWSRCTTRPVSPSTGEMFRLAGATDLLAACAARPHVRGIVSGHLHEAFERLGR